MRMQPAIATSSTASIILTTTIIILAIVADNLAGLSGNPLR
ncbi:MAG TPA: hypothetical protein VGY98_06845 [Verrucomicrobiae bacterium]|nr:hypothetical protein [Verrucomicrobiae bacterium]